jgi:hypothetical protein
MGLPLKLQACTKRTSVLLTEDGDTQVDEENIIEQKIIDDFRKSVIIVPF